MSPHIIKAASGVNGHQQTQTDTPRHPWTMSGWKTHNFGTTQEGGNFFHLALLGYQNMKTSLHFLPKNHWGRPFFAIFSSVREKLQLTVSLNQLNFQKFQIQHPESHSTSQFTDLTNVYCCLLSRAGILRELQINSLPLFRIQYPRNHRLFWYILSCTVQCTIGKLQWGSGQWIFSIFREKCHFHFLIQLVLLNSLCSKVGNVGNIR